VENYQDEKLDPSVSAEKAGELKARLSSNLARGASSLTVEESFRIAVEIESSEIDAIYSKLLKLGGPNVARTMENLGVPASVQRQKLKAALRRFCASSPELIQAAETL
jgi:hypothetical protein